MDLLFRNGTIVDGTGAAPVRQDLLIRNDRVADVGHFPDARADRVIDATGLMIVPGLIDCHTHSELDLLRNRQHPNAVYQGLSTVVTGMCGLGFAPIRPQQWKATFHANSGIFGRSDASMLPWNSFEEWMERFEGCAVNVCSLTTHNAIRQMACGFENQPLTGSALDKAKDALDAALSQGASGFSVGLSYYPGAYSDTEELVELAKVIARHDAVFCVHMRLNTIGPSFHPMDEIAEVIQRTGVRTHMLHHRTKAPTTLGHPEAIIAPFEKVMKNGAKVTFEFYPYLAMAGYLLVMLPGWVQEGGPEATMERLMDLSLRERILKDVQYRYQLNVPFATTGVFTHFKDPYSSDVGKTFEQLALERQCSIPQLFVDLLIENELEVGWRSSEPQDEELRAALFDDQFAMLSMDCYTIGSDTILVGDQGHPRAFGTFARTLKMARERGMAPETAIRKLTALPAEIYRLKDRGQIRKGAFADLCLLDWENICDKATFDHPRRAPEGVRQLYVNGRCALEDGHITGILGGHSLRRGE